MKHTRIQREADKKQWKVWTEPKPTLHYPALYTGTTGVYTVSSAIYPSEEVARKKIGNKFIRLAIEYPSVLLTPRA